MNIESKEITLLPIEKHYILHTISIPKQMCNGGCVIGDILYKRNLTEYTKTQHLPQESQFVDCFDELLFQGVQKVYPNARRSEELIFLDSQEEYVKIRLKRPKQDVCFLFSPEFNNLDMACWNDYATRIFSVHEFSMHIYANYTDASIFMYDHFVVNYNISQVKEVSEMIKKVHCICL